MISRKFKLSHQQIIDMAASFEDDVLFRCAPASLMWVSRWTDEASAKRFARLYQDVLRDGKIETDGALVITTVGEFQGREKLLSLLR